MGGKIDKITKSFDKVEHFKNQGVTYWTKWNRPVVIQIIGQFKKTAQLYGQQVAQSF